MPSPGLPFVANMSLRRACLLLPLLALLSVAASHVKFAWRPHDLTASVTDQDNGYNTLGVSWRSGDCGLFDLSTISIVRDGVVRSQRVKTERGYAEFDECEYWSRYDVILEAGVFCGSEKLQISIETGPGQPHKPEAFMVVPHSNSADFTIVEAFMPREITGYELLVCRVDIDALNECKDMTFVNHTAVDGLQNGTITDLVSQSMYSYKLNPIILDGSKNYRGISLTGYFNTTGSAYPDIIDVTATYSEKNSTLSAAFTWKMAKPDLPVRFFLVTVEPCSTDCTRSTFSPGTTFTNLTFSTEVSLEIFAMFFVDEIVTAKNYTFNLKTPDHFAPIEHLDVARMSPTEAYIGWPPTKRRSDFEVKLCEAENCTKPARQPFTDIHVTSREPGALFYVEIMVVQENFMAEYFKGHFEMLKHDYETPRIISIDPTEELWSDVVYTINASAASDATVFEVEACSLRDRRRDCHHASSANISDAKLFLNYFEKYEVELTAVHELPLGKEVRRSCNTTMRTIGTDPEAVGNLYATNITSRSLDLRWEPPRNVPSPVEGWLEINFEISTGSKNWTTSHTCLHVTDLQPYEVYHFSVRAIVLYIGGTFIGKVTQTVLRTDASAPGEAQNLCVIQRLHSPTVVFSWSPPRDANGPSNYYFVAVKPLTGASTQGFPVKDTATNITLPVTLDDTTYLFSVAAATENSKHEVLVGVASELNVIVPGIGLRVNVSLLGRNADSLQVLIQSSEDDKKPRKHFYLITDWTGRTENTSLPIATITGLRTYHTETLKIHACYAADYCTQAIIFEAQTDVGAPSAVRGLEAAVSNLTNLVVGWREPETKNGPLNGYVVEIIDETDESVRETHTVLNKTHFVYNTTDEYEKFQISVKSFNTLIDNPSDNVYGTTSTVERMTSGFSVPKVENLRLVSADATVVSVAWDEPLPDSRFNLTVYAVEVLGSQRSPLMTQDRLFTVSGFEPFKNFTIGLRSCTGNLTAPNCGLPRKISGKTDAAAPSEPRKLAVRTLDKSTVIISWERPVRPNGEIQAYTLSITNSTTTTTQYFKGIETSYKAEYLKPSQTYFLKLTAHTFNKHHQRLDSPPAATQFSTRDPTPKVLIALLIMGGLFLVIAAFTAVWYFWGRARRYQPMPDEPAQ